MKNLGILLILLWIGQTAFSQDWDWTGAISTGSIDDDIAFAAAENACGTKVAVGFFSAEINFGGTTLLVSGEEDGYVAEFDESGFTGNVLQVTSPGRVRVFSVTSDGIYFYVLGTVEGIGWAGSHMIGGTGDPYSNFVLGLDNDLNVLWAQTLGQTTYDQYGGITIDQNGNVVIASSFFGADPVNCGAENFLTNGLNDIFATGFDPDDGTPLWSHQAGGAGNDFASDIAADGGNLFVTGNFNGILHWDTLSAVSAGLNDIFTAGLDATGNALWINPVGGPTSDAGTSISARNGKVAVGNSFTGSAEFHGITLVSGGSASQDIATILYDASGNFLWVRPGTSVMNSVPNDILIDEFGDVWITGRGAAELMFAANYSESFSAAGAFLVRYAQNGNVTLLEKADGSCWDEGRGLMKTPEGVWIVGDFECNNFTAGNFVLESLGQKDPFILQFSADPVWTPEVTKQNAHIFPNPATHLFSFETDEPGTLQIFNLMGQCVLSEKVWGKTTFEISHLSAGMYSLVWTSESGEITRDKLIVR